MTRSIQYGDPTDKTGQRSFNSRQGASMCITAIGVLLSLMLTSINSTLASAQVASADVVHPDSDVLVRADGPGSCPCLFEAEGDSLYLDYKVLPETTNGEFPVELKLGTDTFKVDLDHSWSGFGKLSLLFFKFGNRRLYGVQASSGIVNTYYSYFYYVNTRFHYLGVFPELSYDKKHDLFVGHERDGNDWHTTYFRLSHRVTLSPSPGP